MKELRVGVKHALFTFSLIRIQFFLFLDKLAQTSNASSKTHRLEEMQGSQSKLKKIFVETLRNVRTIKSISEHEDSGRKTSKMESSHEIERDYEKMMQKLEKKKEKRVKIVKEIKELQEKGVMKWERKERKLNLIKEGKVILMVFFKHLFYHSESNSPSTKSDPIYEVRTMLYLTVPSPSRPVNATKLTSITKKEATTY